MSVASQFLKKIWILIKIIIAVLLCTALVVNLYLIWAQLSNKSSLPKIFGFAQVIVISGSMQPAIEAGDLIIIKGQEEYEKNDIVTYRENNTLITHRIVETNQSEVVTKGDANNTSDKPILQSDIEGKVILRLPGAGNIVLFLRKPTGILAVSCMVLLLFMISRRDQSHRRQKKKR
jgi:signal peptidase